VSSNYPKGSEWRQWDLHIHTPASFHWNGAKFIGDPLSPENYPLIDEMILALNAAQPAVFALMDYWTFDGWFALKNRLTKDSAPKLEKTVFPGIELRLVAPMEGRLNAHVLFSDKIDDQVLIDFKSELLVALIDRPLSDYSLRQIARHVGADLLKSKGFKKEQVDVDDIVALKAGSSIAEISCDSYKKALKNVPKELALGFMPFNTNDGLADVKWHEHYAYVLGLFETSPIFETRTPDLWAAFANVETDGNKSWITNFQNALGNTPRLAVSGSDAHMLVGVTGDNDKRGYGDYPSGKATWIKADPTFSGLLQAIKEPDKRSWIGEKPSKLNVIENNKSQFIESIEISKNVNAKSSIGNWIAGASLKLNPDLVAVIGNKGSGKSALADITALLGNSTQSHHFSFLKKDRFRGKNGEPAKHFDATLTWADQQITSKNLEQNPDEDSVELVKYIPQGHFEELCNAHVSGKSEAFERELRGVIFSHVDEGTRLGALNFEQLVEAQENNVREKLSYIRSFLTKLNRDIVDREAELEPAIRSSVLQKIKHKQHIVDELKKVKPEEVFKPTDELSSDEKTLMTSLSDVTNEIKKHSEDKFANIEVIKDLSKKLKASSNLREKIFLLNRDFKNFEESSKEDVSELDIELKELASLTISTKKLEEIDNRFTQEMLKIQANTSEIEKKVEVFKKQQTEIATQLNEPQQRFQKYEEEVEAWKAKLKLEEGSVDEPESLSGLMARLKQLDQVPEELVLLNEKRFSYTLEIFDVLSEQKNLREEIFRPVQELIMNDQLIRDEYKLQFKSELTCTADKFGDHLFDLIKQTSGELRGDESYNLIVNLMDQNDLDTKAGVKGFIKDLINKLHETSSSASSLIPLMRKSKEPKEVYDYIFSLEFLIPRYTLMFQDAHIEQLSPGQRGALLLIFYLLVDKGSVPIILDQPEENLDNETIVSLLVPVLCKAKQYRQILMVTHNPNLAVVCDAEQIIHCEFDRKNDSTINYTSGSIESTLINQKVVDVLEGTMPAFSNREQKYNKD
jgi:ABC-type lipoprotein export system ATPase subunit